MECLQKLYRKGKIQGFAIYPIVNKKEVKRMGMFQKEPPGIMAEMLFF